MLTLRMPALTLSVVGNRLPPTEVPETPQSFGKSNTALTVAIAGRLNAATPLS